jgi:hypothetical protein
MRDLGYVIDFKNEEWAKGITYDGDWIVFVGTLKVKNRTRFLIPKSCALSAFEALLKCLGYNARVKALTKRKDIHRLTIGW